MLLLPLLVLLLIAGVIVFIVYAMRYSMKVSDSWKVAAQNMGLQFHPIGMQKRALRGTFEGYPITVETISDGTDRSRVSHTRYRVSYAPIGLGLHLKEQGALAGVARSLGFQDVEVGDPKFDPYVVVKGHSEPSLREYLTPFRRFKIRRALKRFEGLEIRDEGLEYRCYGLERDSLLMMRTLKDLVGLAGCADQGGRSRKPSAAWHSRPTRRGARGRAR